MTSEQGAGRRPPKDAARKSGPALEAIYASIVWLFLTLDKLPRRQKLLLGDRIQSTAPDALKRPIKATYSKARERALGDANLGVESLRFLLRAAWTRSAAGWAAGRGQTVPRRHHDLTVLSASCHDSYHGCPASANGWPELSTVVLHRLVDDLLQYPEEPGRERTGCWRRR
jgi:hypothetical protein